MYLPFIDDPAHVALLDGERYVVLRATGAVREVYVELQAALKQRLAGQDVSFPAQPHVTLLGLARGTSIDTVLGLVTEWAAVIPPLCVAIEKMASFPPPFQIPIVQLRRTAELAGAMSSLRASAARRGLPDLGAIAPSDWIFHMSVAYCSGLTAALWADLEPWLGATIAPPVETVVYEAEIVAFDNGQERSGGVIALAGELSRPDAGGAG